MIFQQLMQPASSMHAYTASPQKPWILDSRASSHGTKQEFVSLNLSCLHPSVKIVDGTHSPVLGNGVVQATSSLTLTDILYVPRFSVSLLSISQFTKHNNCKITFFPSHCMFQDLSTGKRIDLGHERGGIYYLDDRVTPTGLVSDQPDTVLLWRWRLGHPSVQKFQSVIPVESSISSLDCESYELVSIIMLRFRVELIIVAVLHSNWFVLMSGVLVVYPPLRVLDLFALY